MREDLETLIEATSPHIHRRYRQWVELEDVQQEMWKWAYEQKESNINKLSKFLLKQRLYRAGERYARKEKAIRSGYDVGDEHFYSIASLRELLPLALAPAGANSSPVDDRDSKTARRGAAGPGMELETALADVRRAYNRVSGVDQLALASYVAGDGGTPAVDAALRRMQRALGGRKPRREAA